MASHKTKTTRASQSLVLPLKMGFLGGGQLARMMVLEAHRLGIEAHVYSESLTDPAAQVTSFHTQGKLTDFSSLQKFIQNVSCLTFESEFVPPEILAQLEKKAQPFFFPRPEIMKRLQNRQSQKEILKEFKIPTAPFIPVLSQADLQQAWKKLKGPFVLKKNFGGYDGYGTFFAKKEADTERLKEKLPSSPEGFVAEQFVPFKRELAAILVRSSQGKMISLPLVETSQVNGRCDWVRGPVHHPKWAALKKRLFSMLQKLNYVGCMGVEIFDTGKELWINELAPRVHNSGHYSQNALTENQFALHLKAGLGLDLPPLQLVLPQFVMVNVLGQSSEPLQLPKSMSGHLHLYGKLENRTGRKLGHVNYLGPKGAALLRKALQERKKLQ